MEEIGATFFALALAFAAAPAQSAEKLTDPQIAHIAYTAGVIDIKAAQLALKMSKNADVIAFANNMVSDHHGRERPGTRASEEARTSRPRTTISARVSSSRRTRNRQSWRRSAAPPSTRPTPPTSSPTTEGQWRAREDADPGDEQCRAQGAAVDRPEDLPGPPGARRDARQDAEIGRRIHDPTIRCSRPSCLPCSSGRAGGGRGDRGYDRRPSLLSGSRSPPRLATPSNGPNKDFVGHTATAATRATCRCPHPPPMASGSSASSRRRAALRLLLPLPSDDEGQHSGTRAARAE